jgi:tripartite-type tricarboxylate transporter receptor subunit TctC
MCVRADQPFTNINDFLKGKSRVTVANTASLFDGVYDELTEDTGVKFVRVDINGSKNIIKALIAGDTDLMYSGFTKREINNKQINCFTTSSNTEIAGRIPMNKLFPKWRLNETGTLKYFHAANIDDSNLDTVRKDLKRVIESEKIASYIEKAYMTPGTKIDNQQKAFWSIVDVLTGKK